MPLQQHHQQQYIGCSLQECNNGAASVNVVITNISTVMGSVPMAVEPASVCDLDTFAAIATSVAPLPEPASKNHNTQMLSCRDSTSTIASQSSVLDSILKTPRKRQVHNQCERKRRDNIRDGFERLQSHITARSASPYAAATPARHEMSKMDILRAGTNNNNYNSDLSYHGCLLAGIEHIRRLQTSIRTLNAEVEALRRQRPVPAESSAVCDAVNSSRSQTGGLSN